MRRMLKQFVTTVIISLASLSVNAAEVLRDYWSYYDFLAAHPQQQAWVSELRHSVLGPASPIPFTLTTPVKIDLMQPTEQISSYWWRNLKSMEKRLEELGIAYEINLIQTKPTSDQRAEIEAMTSILENEPDYFVFTLNTNKQRQLIEHAIKTSETKVILQNITGPVKAWGNEQPFMYVGFDHEEGAKKLADYFNQALPQKGQYGVLYYSPGFISDARGDTFVSAMKKAGNHQLVSAFYTQATLESAYTATLKMLSEHQNLNMIYACSTDIALGAIKAIQETGRTEVMINGWGGGDSELVEIKNDNMEATIMRMNDDTGVAIAEAIRRDLLGIPVPTVFSGDFELVTERDSHQRIDQLSTKAFRYSGQYASP